jgi:L-fucose mutarotase
MLKNVDATLNADVLHALCSMGHGDEVVIVDAHYPAEAAARESIYGKLLRMEAADTARAVRAVLSVIDLDDAEEYSVDRMLIDRKEEDFMPEVQKEVQVTIDNAAGITVTRGIPRHEFHDRAKKAFCIIVTGETRSWGCYILRKGLSVTPDAPATEKNSRLDQYSWASTPVALEPKD